MATWELGWSVRTGGSWQDVRKQFTNTGCVEIDETVANGQTDKLVTFSLDVSQIKAFELYSDVAVTVETNAVDHSGGNQIVLVAGLPYRWCSDDYNTFLLTVDVTKLYITNASGSTANITIRALYDPTV